MEIHDRIRTLRKTHLKMSQTDFGKRLGVSRDVINNIENNRLAKPEQKLSLLKLICSEFNVNEEWLREGTGEMFVERSYFSLDDYAEAKNLSELDKEVIKNFMELDRDTRHAVYDVIVKAFSAEAADPELPAADRVKAAEDAYIKSRSDTAPNTDSSATGTI